MKPKTLTKKVSNQLVAIHKQLESLNLFDEFSLFNRESCSLQNFEFFVGVVEDKAKAYAALRTLTHYLTKIQSIDDGEKEVMPHHLNKDSVQEEQYPPSSQISSKACGDTIEKIQVKMEEIFDLLEKYLKHQEASQKQENFKKLREQNIKQLRTAIANKDSISNKITQIKQEFDKIHQVLKEKLEYERSSLENFILGFEARVSGPKETRSNKPTLAIEPTKAPKGGVIKMDQIKIEADATEVACNLTSKAVNNDT